jgi:hypothetical protein
VRWSSLCPWVFPFFAFSLAFRWQSCIGTLFQLRGNNKLLLLRIVAKVKNIGLATNLAIFHIGLGTPGGFVYGSVVPLTAAGTLECRFHERNCIFNLQFMNNWKLEIGN